MHSVMRTLGRYRADTAAARCAVCGGARLWRGAVRGVCGKCKLLGGPKKRRRADTEDEDTRGLGPDLGLVWCRFVLGLPTDNSVISFRLANRNRTDNNFLFFFIFFPHEPSLFPHEPRFFSPRTEIFPHEPRFFFPTKFLEAPGRRRSLSVHYRFGQPKPINWVIVSVGQTEVGPYSRSSACA